MTRTKIRLLLVAMALGSGLFRTPHRLAAQEVELGGLLAEAERSHPAIVAADRAVEAARARVSQAGAPPDPRLFLGLINMPITDLGLGRDPMTMTQVQLGSTLPWPGKLSLRERVAAQRSEAAEWEAERVRQRIAAEVKSVYYEIYFLDRAREVTARNEGLIADLAEVTAVDYAVGRSAQAEVLDTRVERARLTDQRLGLEERRAGAVARLNALLARPTDTPLPGVRIPAEVMAAALTRPAASDGFTSSALADVLGPSRPEPGRPGLGGPGHDGGDPRSTDPLPDLAELQRLAVEHNPGVQAHVRRVAAQRRSMELAEKAKLPDFDVSAGYSHRLGFGDFFNVSVSAPLPIFSGRKQDAAVAEKAAGVAEHEAVHHTMVNDLGAEIASLRAKLQRTRAQLVVLAGAVLPQARSSLAATTASVQVGRAGLRALMTSQVSLYRHDLDYHRLLSDFARDLAALERAVGTEVLR